MSETRTLLSKIVALRQRLEQAQGLANEARSVAAALVGGEAVLEKILDGSRHDVTLDAVVRPLVGGENGHPRALTSRARKVLEQGRELLGRLREMSEAFSPEHQGETAKGMSLYYRDTVALIDTTLRTVSLLPESPAAQLHLSQGLEVTLSVVTNRLRTLQGGLVAERREQQQIERLGGLLTAMEAGHGVPAAQVEALADEILAEVQECVPLRFLCDTSGDVVRHVACHGLTTARVLARVIRHEPLLRQRAREAVLGALLHDVGMLGVPPEVLFQQEELSDEQRRLIESHAVVSAQQVAGLVPDLPWLAEAVGAHHERMDGTGYPDGLKGSRIQPLGRLLAVCDVYAALNSPRPHRPARATRTALADTLLLAEQGQLDERHAECLLHLSFYPVGSMVELSHGAVGVVVAVPSGSNELPNPARPVVAVLTDGRGDPLPRPQHLDLALTDNHSIVRSLNPAERQDLLARRFPEWAA